MRTIFASLAALALALPCIASHAAATIQFPGWQLALDDDWTLLRQTDPAQQVAMSKGWDTAVTTSILPMIVKLPDMERVARKLQEVRLMSEQDGARRVGTTATIVDPVLAPAPGGYVLTYHGHDSGGRQFRFHGRITQRGILSVYAESPSRSEAELSTILERVVTGLSPDSAQP
jgi:hypothetical protein